MTAWITVRLCIPCVMYSFYYTQNSLRISAISPRLEMELLNLITLSAKYRVKVVIKRVIQRFVHNFSEAKACECLQLPEEVKSLEIVQKNLLENARNFIVEKYASIRDVLNKNKKEFFLLPFEAVDVILANDKLEVDSENSVFYAAIKWVEAERPNREKYIGQLLSDFRKCAIVSCWMLFGT